MWSAYYMYKQFSLYICVEFVFFVGRDLSEGTKCVKIQESYHGLSVREQKQK